MNLSCLADISKQWGRDWIRFQFHPLMVWKQKDVFPHSQQIVMKEALNISKPAINWSVTKKKKRKIENDFDFSIQLRSRLDIVHSRFPFNYLQHSDDATLSMIGTTLRLLHSFCNHSVLKAIAIQSLFNSYGRVKKRRRKKTVHLWNCFLAHIESFSATFSSQPLERFYFSLLLFNY